MNKPQAAQLIKNTFTRPFDRGRFRTFALNLVNRMDESKAFSRNIQYIKDAFKPHVSRFERLGTYTSPDKETVDVLIVHLTQASKLERARTAIRNFVADHLKDRDEKDAALVAFVSPAEAQWRFSYVKMEYATVKKESGKVGVETRLTPARRFSYLVGEGESCHTAQTRFLGLLQDTDTDPTLAQMEEAFSVEAVTKEFFGKYAERFDDIHAALDKMVAKDKTLRNEFKEKNVSTVDFAKKLLGQVVFLYFLQKKGWLGVEKGKDWGTGPRDFLRRMARGEYGKYNNFFNDILEPLFYDTLATDRGHEAWCARFKCRIPFLNGGLFEPLNDYDWKKTDILIPNKLFTNDEFVEEGITGTGVLDVFDRYNFTVNEAEPLEKEVAIDPEMLGKVFENLIEENRRKGLGAFYTPREIVHYMCQESLMNYLEAAVNAVPRADVETFVRLGEQISHYAAVDAKYAIKMPKSIEKNAKALDEALKSITVCDPAVGSGAFPVGMMTEIVRARAALTPYFNDVAERTPYHFKRHAIQNCLYGVDIDASAVEIAKLRLWLSLIVDEEDVKQVKPLPNLDYKIVIGNSLLGFPFKSQRVHRIEVLKIEFFNEPNTEKKHRLKQEIDREIVAAFGASKKSLGYEVNFDFEIFFSEVFHAKGGFDVVIANPPYVRQEKIKEQKQSLKAEGYECYNGTADLLVYFYERGVKLLRSGGVLTFITSNKFYRAGYGAKLRGFLARKLALQRLIDFGDAPVFEAIAYASILIGTRTPPPKDAAALVYTWEPGLDFAGISGIVTERGQRIAQAELKPDGWCLESPIALRLFEKLKNAGTPLGQYVNGRFYYGIKTGLNEAFIVDRATRDRLIREHKSSAEVLKPFLRGRDVKRWRCNFAERYLIKIESSENKTHPWSGKPAKEAEKVFAKTYPAIHSLFATMRDALIKRYDQGKFFWELRSCDYWQEFEKPKIVYPDIYEHQSFAWDKERFFSGNTTYFIPTDEAWLTSHLNSLPVEWLYSQLSNRIRGGYFRAFSDYMKQIPIPAASSADKARLTKLAERAAKQAEAEDAAGLRATERAIDEIVYRLFDLTPDEVGHIEKSLAGVRAGGAGDDEEDSDA